MANSTSLAAQNKAALDYFVQTPVTREMVSYLAFKASEVIRCDEPSVPSQAAGDLPTPPTTPPRDLSDPSLPSLEAFITSIIQQSHVQVATLMPALVYLARLRERLPPAAQGIPSTVHRIFLAALILAAKNLNDSSPKNKHWARYTSVPGYPGFCFTNTEVNLMEKQMLYLLDWNMQITNEDLFFHLEPFLAPIRVKQQQRAERKMQAMIREREQAEIRRQQAVEEEQRRHIRQQSISALACPSQINLSHIVEQARKHSYSSSVASSSSTMYDSPATSATPYSTTDSPARCGYSRSRSDSLVPPSLTHSRASSRAPTTRTPSLSPPTRSDSGSLTSLGSSLCGTPADLPYPARPEEAKCAMPVSVVHPMVVEYSSGYTYMHHDIPEVVHIQPVLQKPLPMPVMAVAPPVVPSQMQQKPLPAPVANPASGNGARRLRSAGSLLSRMMGGFSGAGTPQTMPVQNQYMAMNTAATAA